MLHTLYKPQHVQKDTKSHCALLFVNHMLKGAVGVTSDTWRHYAQHSSLRIPHAILQRREVEPQSNLLITLSILTSLKVTGKFFFSLKTKEGA